MEPGASGNGERAAQGRSGGWRRGFLGLGANLGDREAQLRAALDLLAGDDLRIEGVAGLWETEPVGLREQPWFLNTVAEVATRLEPEALLRRALAVERALGRVRTVRWGPRTIDVDLLWLEGVVRSGAELTLPHPRMAERAFVLAPLAELAPGLRLPGGRTAREGAEALRAAPGAPVVRRLRPPGWYPGNVVRPAPPAL
ncbi:MAG: 2-amino-4-hydroxy-6-hydroxymethyldihydropteridine diphosphokinase [Bacillota bacterium]|nr:2-amino-4-hydroxy-6-hydroxymethyldihydropteridine diphosphokinase [Bacillota bacterium]